MPVISLCIPTYNRSSLLSVLLDSILEQQCVDEVEVVISDDGSTDETAITAETYRSRFKNFTFIAQPTNVGIDGNFLAVVAAATSPYIWLVGDDDRLEPGSIRLLLEAIEKWPQAVGFTLGVIDYDATMSTPVGIRNTPPTQLMTGSQAVFSSMADLLGFMSALVVKRDLWNREVHDPAIRAIRNYYVQVIILGRILGESGQWGVIQTPCVGFRTENDQLQARYGWLDRLKIDAKAYNEIADILFAHAPKTRATIRRRIFKTHIMARIINAKTRPGPTEEVKSAFVFLAKAYGTLPAFWLQALPMLIAPKWFIRNARSFYKKYARSSGARRTSLTRSASGR